VKQLGHSRARGRIQSWLKSARRGLRCGRQLVVTSENSVVGHGKSRLVRVILWWYYRFGRMGVAMYHIRNRPANLALHPTPPASLTRRCRRG
jgi:hypothetical protein